MPEQHIKSGEPNVCIVRVSQDLKGMEPIDS